MVLLVSNDGHRNYHEGVHVGFHDEVREGKDWLIVVIESKGNSTIIEIGPNDHMDLYLMNAGGKTVETRHING